MKGVGGRQTGWNSPLVDAELPDVEIDLARPARLHLPASQSAFDEVLIALRDGKSAVTPVWHSAEFSGAEVGVHK